MTGMSDAFAFAKWLEECAVGCGALTAGCLRADSARLDAAGLGRRFEAWLTAGNAGALGYVDRSLVGRSAPFVARPWARAAVVVTFAGDWAGEVKLETENWKLGELTTHNPQPTTCHTQPDSLRLPAAEAGRPGGRISAYARGRDYHEIGQALLAELARRLPECFPEQREPKFEACVDTRPVPEVALAAAAGLGVIGHNGLLRTPQRGCQGHVGVLFTDLDLPEAVRNPEFAVTCAECGACVRNCPTGALTETETGGAAINRVRLCRSWLGMEQRGPFPQEDQRRLGGCLFGCDVCTVCCPEVRHQGRGARPDDLLPELADLEWILTTPARELERRLAGTALAHAGATRLKRNAAALLGNLLTGAERQAWRERLLRESRSPGVRETVAAWE